MSPISPAASAARRQNAATARAARARRHAAASTAGAATIVTVDPMTRAATAAFYPVFRVQPQPATYPCARTRMPVGGMNISAGRHNHGVAAPRRRMDVARVLQTLNRADASMRQIKATLAAGAQLNPRQTRTLAQFHALTASLDLHPEDINLPTPPPTYRCRANTVEREMMDRVRANVERRRAGQLGVGSDPLTAKGAAGRSSTVVVNLVNVGGHNESERMGSDLQLVQTSATAAAVDQPSADIRPNTRNITVDMSGAINGTSTAPDGQHILTLTKVTRPVPGRLERRIILARKPDVQLATAYRSVVMDGEIKCMRFLKGDAIFEMRRRTKHGSGPQGGMLVFEETRLVAKKVGNRFVRVERASLTRPEEAARA